MCTFAARVAALHGGKPAARERAAWQHGIARDSGQKVDERAEPLNPRHGGVKRLLDAETVITGVVNVDAATLTAGTLKVVVNYIVDPSFEA